MKSGSRVHFPPVRIRDRRKLLWSQLTRKTLTNRPEERVRLRYIDYLTLELGWPKSRLSAETMLGSRQTPSRERADLIGYDRSFKPAFLIECKAASIHLDENAAEQVAIYNRKLNAPLICLTNGIEEFWYDVRGDHIQPLETHPIEKQRPISEIRLNRFYWQNRGFLGDRPLFSDPADDIRLPMQIWSRSLPWISRYMNIPYRSEELVLEHDYRVARSEHGTELAFTTLADSAGDSWLAAIHLTRGRADGLLTANLNRFIKGETPRGTLINDQQQTTLDLSGVAPLEHPDDISHWVEDLADRLIDMFR